MIQSIGILHINRVTSLAARKIQFVVVGNSLKQVPGPFKTQAALRMQHKIRFERSAHAVAILYIGAWPAGVDAMVTIFFEQAATTK